MHGKRRWVEVNPPIPVYKGRDGRRSDDIAFFEGEDEGSRPMTLERRCVCTGLGSRRVAFDGVRSSMRMHRT
jgi:hypothetical protein